MRLPPNARPLAAAALLALAPAAARAQTPDPLYVGLGWQTFQFAGTGPVYFPAYGYAFTLAAAGTVRVVDGGIVGNVFQVFLNGAATPALTTTAPAPGLDGVDTGALDGDAAWADPRLGRGTLALGPGSYVLTVAVTRQAAGTTDGQGYVDVNVSTVPEPSAGAAVAVGLLLAGVAARRGRLRAAGRAG